MRSASCKKQRIPGRHVMYQPPFDIVDCSWPRAVQCADGVWMSEPEWDTPVMRVTPQPGWQKVQGQLCWLIDWKKFFKGGLVQWVGEYGGEMRGFHIIFRLRINTSGKLIFWADDGCVIRRNDCIIHHDKRAHTAVRSEIEVIEGDLLLVAQWQKDGDWIWGAQPISSGEVSERSASELWTYYEAALTGIRQQSGPPVKMYSNAATPMRTVISLYSLILNGYAPSEVHLFGEHQWSRSARDLLSSMLPFATIVSTDHVVDHIRRYGGSELADKAMRHWWVMKTLVSVLYPPEEFCAIDDDVFILDDTSDALEAFREHDLVFATDTDHGEEYVSAWEPAFGGMPLYETAKFNAGLYWMRNVHDPLMIAEFVQRVSPEQRSEYIWEQGFVDHQ